MKTEFALCAAAATAIAVRYLWGILLPNETTLTRDTAVVTELFVFPIKGVRGMSVSSWPLSRRGFLYDREWAVAIRSDNSSSLIVVSSNRFSKLAAATATVNIHDNTLVVTAPGMSPLVVLLTDDSSRNGTHPFALFGMSGAANEVSTEASSWWQRYLGNDNIVFCRISQSRKPIDSPSHQGCPVSAHDDIGFHDYAAFHIICNEGVEWLREQIPPDRRAPEHRIETAQFRPNIVVRGLPFPDEDTWREVTIGEIRCRVAKQSGRCVIPTHNSIGDRDPFFEPTATLRRLRRTHHRHQAHLSDKQFMFMFGVDMFPSWPIDDQAKQKILVGDVLRVRHRQSPPRYIVD